ncbi:MAG: hypothetical protein GXP40_11145 [Chloroflexi bacterium]|nr:hypothetical protein [Chloroflexota bacterium]
MPSIIQSLHGHDLGHLRIIAQLWGVELQAGEANPAREELATALLDRALVAEVVETLPEEARSALDALTQNEGRLPWVSFVRRFGDVREMGPGRRDRARPHLNPVSAAEMLFYRALLARAFFDTPNGAQEFAYIPDDLLHLLQPEGKQPAKRSGKASAPAPLGRLARPDEHAHHIPATDHILDDATTYLAALRLGWTEPPHPLEIPVRFMRDILSAARLIGDSGLQPGSVKSFLEAERGVALTQLIRAWLESETLNELRQIPGLVCEGAWTNDPHAARHFILDRLTAIPRGKWWNLNAFVQAVKEEQPDFQRPAGDYDSWFIRRADNDAYLRGFEHWDEVDGALIRYLISGPLHWLGIVDLASASENGPAAAFRLTSDKLLSGKTNLDFKDEHGKLIVASNGRITVARLAPRVARYLIARFCDWEAEREDEYVYRITPAALERARGQGLKVSHLLGLLEKHAATPIPPSLVRALQRWDLNGTEARVENLVVLRLSSPKTLEALRRSKAGRFLGKALGPSAVTVQAGAASKVVAALVEMGFLAEDKSTKHSKEHE